jgi:CheY-like chemotaxis protein
MLPDFSGLDLVRIVKRERPGLRAVAITGSAMSADTVAAAGFDAHLLKPVTLQEVLARL